MIFTEIGAWCCSILQEACYLSVYKGYLAPLYKTACFFKNAFCGTFTAKETNIFTADTSRPSGQVTHYLEYVFGNITGLSQHIEGTSPDLLASEHPETPRNTPVKIITSLQMLAKEEQCFLNWCEIYDHVTFWWRELYKKWWVMVNSSSNQNLKFLLENNIKVVADKEERMDIDCVTSTELKHLLLGCIVGAIVVVLCFRIKDAKPKFVEDSNKAESTNLDATTSRRLIERVEATANYCKKAVEKSEATMYCLSLEVHEKLNKLVDRNQNVNIQHPQVTKLENKCKEYERELAYLNTEFRNSSIIQESEKEELQRRHNKEIKQLQKLLDETKGQLNLLRNLHENEVKRLHQEVAKLQTEKTNEINTLKKVIADTQKRLNDNETNAAQQESLIRNLNQPMSKAQHETSSTTAQQDPYITESLKNIEDVFKKSRELASEVETFGGCKTDKTYLHLKEMLIRSTIELDNIESEGHVIIRQKRKEVLAYVHKHLESLEEKVKM